MKSPKPNDPRRLSITKFGKPTAKHGSLHIPVHVEYDPWCCTEAHEYANAFKAIADLFEDQAEAKERREHIAAHLDALGDKLVQGDELDLAEAIDLLNSVAQYLRELGEEEYHGD